MYAVLIFLFLLMVVAPFWGRWKVYVWFRENMPEEIGIPDLPEADPVDCENLSLDTSHAHLFAGRRGELDLATNLMTRS